MTDVPKNPRPVCILVAKTPAEATVVVGILRGAGIPAHVEGASLADELAVSRRLLNLVGTHVMVPAASEYLAREVLAAGREAGSQPDFEHEAVTAVDGGSPDSGQGAAATATVPGEDPGTRTAGATRPPSRAGIVIWAVVATLVAIGCALQLLDTQARLRELAGGDGGFHMAWSGDWLEVRETKGDRLTSRNLDSNRNGRYECVEDYGTDGRIETRNHDADEDGRYEKVEEFRRSGVRVEWQDVDGDGFMDRGLWHDKDGKLLRVQREAAAGGFVDEPR